jgi:hypothetical protein
MWLMNVIAMMMMVMIVAKGNDELMYRHLYHQLSYC